MLFLYDGRLNELDLSIAKQIDANPKIILENNIFDAAQVLGISASKLTKYCQKIKLKGFKEIKYKIEEEIKQIKYTNETKVNIDIKKVVNPEYFGLIKGASRLILATSKIVVITDEENYELGKLVVSELRRLLVIDVVCYYEKQEMDFEYLNQEPLTIFLDACGKFKLHNPNWYRPGNSYIHMTNEAFAPCEGYYPISLANTDIKYSFNIKIMIILTWIKNKKKNV